ncbi:hypothetical protein [Ignavibacterium album]
MQDIVTYVVSSGISGRMANGLFERNWVPEIFDYRREVLKKFSDFSQPER